MLLTRIKVYRNPWPDTVEDGRLIKIVQRIATGRAGHVESMFDSGEYDRDSISLVILDPSAPRALPSSEVLLAAIIIGPDGERFLPNAIAKAVQHRDKGQIAGYGAKIDLTQTRDGDFCYGFSTQVDGTIVAASGQSEIQDSCEAGYVAVSFNYLVRAARIEWHKGHLHNRWFCKDDQPSDQYVEMASSAATVFDGGANE